MFGVGALLGGALALVPRPLRGLAARALLLALLLPPRLRGAGRGAELAVGPRPWRRW